jgi:hypothetical protein
MAEHLHGEVSRTSKSLITIVTCILVTRK